MRDYLSVGPAADILVLRRVERLYVTFVFAGSLLCLVELGLVLARGRPSWLEGLRYGLATLGAVAWLALGVSAAAGALSTLVEPGKARMSKALRWWVGHGVVALAVGGVAVFALRPWDLRSDPLHFACSVPVATVLTAWGLAGLKARISGRLWCGGLCVVGVGLFLADAHLYRGLYVTLHRALLWSVWVTLAWASAGCAERIRCVPRWRIAPWLLLLCIALGWDATTMELAHLHGSLQANVARVLRAVSDRDGDGYAALLGGGDCDDSQAHVYPGACEIHGNGRDDNCNGRVDAPRPARTSLSSHASDRHGEVRDTEEQGSRPTRRPGLALAGAHMSQPIALPDVYLVVVDCLRADQGGAGVRAERPSVLEPLAQAGLSFSRAYAPYPATFESLAAMAQSRSPRRYAADAADLLTILDRAGYDAQLWIGESRFHIGDPGTPWPPRPSEHPFRLQAEQGAHDWSRRLIDDALSELQAAPGESAPRLRWLHLLDLHVPWRHAPSELSERERYQAEWTHVERLLSRLWAGLARAPRGRRAALLLLGDHGEQLGEHGAHFHDAYVWEESIHVPLLMRLPGVAARRVAQPASLLDVAPTLLHYLGLPEPESFEGYDWLSSSPAGRGPVLAEVGASAVGAAWGPGAQQAVIGPRYKLWWDVSANLRRVYDLRSDPFELRPLVPAHVPQARGLSRALSYDQDLPGCRSAVVRDRR